MRVVKFVKVAVTYKIYLICKRQMTVKFEKVPVTYKIFSQK